MAFSLIADKYYASVLDIDGGALAAAGIKLLLADLDNTLVPYGTPVADQAVRTWSNALRAQGITLFVLSNNRSATRARVFSEDLGVPFIGRAGKPKPHAFHRAMAQLGVTQAQTALVGDQLFTDVLGAKRAGVAAFLVEPIRLSGNPGRYLRYWVELPLRALGKRRHRP